MKEKIAIILTICLTATLLTPAMAFADDTVDTAAVAALEAEAGSAIQDVITEATGEVPIKAPVSLTLDEALTQLDTSVQMQLIEIQHLGDKAVAAGSSEGLDAIKEAKDALRTLKQAAELSGSAELMNQYRSAAFSVDTSSKKQLEMMKSFANEMIPANDTARKNSLNLSATEMYYNLKNMEAQCAIAKDNYDITKTIYEKTQLKYKLGTVSKMDLLSAESDVNTAKDSKIAAENGLAQLQMAFNMFFGYNLNQKVTLTTALGETELPSVTLEDGIKSALANRAEIKEAKYNYSIAKMDFSGYKAYPSTTSKYLGAKAKFLAAEANYNTAADSVEMDVSTKYMDMMQAYEAVKSSATTVANAKETVRLAQLQYEKGYCTLTTVQQAQLGSYSAQLAQAKAFLDLKLAVEKYEYSTGVGLKAATLN